MRPLSLLLVVVSPLLAVACASLVGFPDVPSPEDGGSGSSDDSGSSSGSGSGSSDAGGDSTQPQMDSAATTASVEADTSTRPDAGIDASNPVTTCRIFDASGLDDASVAAGFQQVWEVYRCFSCHQNPNQAVDSTGHGIVLSGNNLGLGNSGTIFPPNLTDDPGTGLGCWTDQQVEDAILKGDDPEGGTLCPPMPKYCTALTAPDGGPRAGTPIDGGTAKQIVDFLRSLPVVTNAVTDTTCPAADGG
jgi:hypothetical protein